MAESNTIILILAAAIAGGTPILLAGLGELVTERAGVLNLGVEGMMVMGAYSAFAAAHATGSPWMGVATAMIAGMFLSAIHAVLVIYLRANQVVSGLALVILGGGLASLFGRPLVGQIAPAFAPAQVPLLSSLPVVGPLLFNHELLVYLAVLATILVAVFLRRTRAGLVLSFCGDNPRMADASGVRVHLVRVAATLFGGLMAGLAGAYITLAETPSWVDGLIAGRGWIALAMVLFAGWTPVRLLFGAWFFGGLVAVQFRAQAFGLALNPYLLAMLPYLATLLILLVTARTRGYRFAAPAALGRPYAREHRQ